MSKSKSMEDKFKWEEGQTFETQTHIAIEEVRDDNHRQQAVSEVPLCLADGISNRSVVFATS